MNGFLSLKRLPPRRARFFFFRRSVGGPGHYQSAQKLRLELAEVLPNNHWKVWERLFSRKFRAILIYLFSRGLYDFH